MHLFSAASYPPDQHVQYRDYVTILAALTVDEPSHHPSHHREMGEKSKCCIATAALHMCLNRERLSEWRREEGKEEVVKERQQRRELKNSIFK